MRIRNWEWYDWGLYRKIAGKENVWEGLYSLRCGWCRRFTLGCGEHRWFCGLCPDCAREIEEDGAIGRLACRRR